MTPIENLFQKFPFETNLKYDSKTQKFGTADSDTRVSTTDIRQHDDEKFEYPQNIRTDARRRIKELTDEAEMAIERATPSKIESGQPVAPMDVSALEFLVIIDKLLSRQTMHNYKRAQITFATLSNIEQKEFPNSMIRYLRAGPYAIDMAKNRFKEVQQ